MTRSCHYRRYTKKTLRALVRRRFSIGKLQYADSLGFVAALIFRLLRKEAESLTPTYIGWYDRWILPVSRVLDVIFHPFMKKDVFAICRQKSPF
jgi:hypothetical protein